jgi:N-acetylneuraminic acid mutarotase
MSSLPAPSPAKRERAGGEGAALAVLSLLAACAGTPNDDSWHAAPPLHHARAAHADVLRHDAKADAWTAMPPIAPRGTMGAVSACGMLHAFGGESQPRQAVLADAFRFDAAHGQWVARSPLPTARNFARAVIFDGAVMVVGGSTVPANSHAAAGSTVVERIMLRALCAS